MREVFIGDLVEIDGKSGHVVAVTTLGARSEYVSDTVEYLDLVRRNKATHGLAWRDVCLVKVEIGGVTKEHYWSALVTVISSRGAL